MRIPSVPIVSRIPEFAAPGWIEYCTRRRMSQSEAIRRAIAYLIEDDESSTNDELVVAAQILEAFPEHSLRSEGRYVRRRVRFFNSLDEVAEHFRAVHPVTPVSPSP